ncbi:MAG: hypothetical protein HY644_15395 [Acidobacteria bacterium]|nr:hypothetical protein [Acidobacteriota bacterium]
MKKEQVPTSRTQLECFCPRSFVLAALMVILGSAVAGTVEGVAAQGFEKRTSDDKFGAAPRTISGQVFEDKDGDGVKEPGESGLQGWTVYVDLDNDGRLDSGETSTTSDASGNYSLSVTEAIYNVREVVQSGWTQTTPERTVNTTGGSRSGVDFGNFKYVTISGTKFDDTEGDGVKDSGEPGLQGFTIFCDDDNNGTRDVGEPVVATLPNGSYSLGGAPTPVGPGTCRLREWLVPTPGWKQTAGDRNITTVSGQNVSGADFGNFKLITISGTKFEDLDGDGVKDTGEPGLSGWRIFLDDNLNGTLDSGEASQLTDASGNYTFGNLGPGTLRVREVLQAGWKQTTSDPSDFASSSGIDRSGVNFGNFKLASIRGTKFEDLDGDGVRDAGEPGIGGWRIFLDDNGNGILDSGEASQLTDSGGNYNFVNLSAGTFKVREVLQPGWKQTTPNPDVATASDAIALGVDFGNQQLSVSTTTTTTGTTTGTVTTTTATATLTSSSTTATGTSTTGTTTITTTTTIPPTSSTGTSTTGSGTSSTATTTTGSATSTTSPSTTGTATSVTGTATSTTGTSPTGTATSTTRTATSTFVTVTTTTRTQTTTSTTLPGVPNQVLVGGPGIDNLVGGEGNDFLDGRPANDTLDGRGGHDTLLGGTGRDNMLGGNGDDTIILRAGDVPPGERENIDGGGGTDRVVLNGGFSASVLSKGSGEKGNTGTDVAGEIGEQRNASALVTDPVTGGAYSIINVEKILHLFLFAQLGNGSQFVSSVDLTNSSATTTAEGGIDFSDDDGKPLPLALNGGPVDNGVDFTIPPLGSVTFNSDGIGTLVTGSAQVLSNVPLGGVVRFSAPGLGIAGVGESQLVDSFITPITRNSAQGVSTGIAVFNFGPATNLRLTLKGLNGAAFRQGQLPIAVDGHVARFIQELFPGLGDFQGTLSVTGSPIAATAIQVGGRPGEFTTLPVTPISPEPAGGTVYFAHLGNGGNLSSSLFLTNPSATERARGELAFLNDDGNRLPISVNGGASASDIPFDIAPQGGAVFTTDGLGAVTTGSARANVTEGVVGGVLRFTLPGIGIAGVGGGGSFNGFISPVRRSRETGINTGVAVNATGRAVTLHLVLRNASGQPVAGGTTTIALKAGGHVARFIDELFPSADTNNFEGTLTVTAEGGGIAATAIQLGSQAGQFTTLPVTRLQ